jgi:hypothetical protein
MTATAAPARQRQELEGLFCAGVVARAHGGLRRGGERGGRHHHGDGRGRRHDGRARAAPASPGVLRCGIPVRGRDEGAAAAPVSRRTLVVFFRRPSPAEALRPWRRLGSWCACACIVCVRILCVQERGGDGEVDPIVPGADRREGAPEGRAGAGGEEGAHNCRVSRLPPPGREVGD